MFGSAPTSRRGEMGDMQLTNKHISLVSHRLSDKKGNVAPPNKDIQDLQATNLRSGNESLSVIQRESLPKVFAHYKVGLLNTYIIAERRKEEKEKEKEKQDNDAKAKKLLLHMSLSTGDKRVNGSNMSSRVPSSGGHCHFPNLHTSKGTACFPNVITSMKKNGKEASKKGKQTSSNPIYTEHLHIINERSGDNLGGNKRAQLFFSDQCGRNISEEEKGDNYSKNSTHNKVQHPARPPFLHTMHASTKKVTRIDPEMTHVSLDENYVSGGDNEDKGVVIDGISTIAAHSPNNNRSSGVFNLGPSPPQPRHNLVWTGERQPVTSAGYGEAPPLLPPGFKSSCIAAIPSPMSILGSHKWVRRVTSNAASTPTTLRAYLKSAPTSVPQGEKGVEQALVFSSAS